MPIGSSKLETVRAAQRPSADTSAMVALATCNRSSTVNTPRSSGAAADERDNRSTREYRMRSTLSEESSVLEINYNFVSPCGKALPLSLYRLGRGSHGPLKRPPADVIDLLLHRARQGNHLGRDQQQVLRRHRTRVQPRLCHRRYDALLAIR